MTNLKLENHGIYFFGLIEDVDFTKAGKGTDDDGNPLSWGDSVKLRFMIDTLDTFEIDGEEVSKEKSVLKVLSIPCESETVLLRKFRKYEKLKGNEILVSLPIGRDAQGQKINENNIIVLGDEPNPTKIAPPK